MLSYSDCSTAGRQSNQRLTVTINNVKHCGECIHDSQTIHMQEGSVDVIRWTPISLRGSESGVSRSTEGVGLSCVWTEQRSSRRVSETCVSTASQEARCKDYCRRLVVPVVTVGKKQASILCAR